jgi:hypothetical protein
MWQCKLLKTILERRKTRNEIKMSGDFPFFECLNPGSYQPHGNP